MNAQTVKEAILRSLSALLSRESKERMPSRTLRSSLSVDIRAHGTGDTIRLSLPYFWARYAHDGRGSVKMPAGKYMIFFPDIEDDPRVDGGNSYPQGKSDRRKLSHEEFVYFVKINRDRARQGLPPIMIITNEVGPAEGTHFYEQAAIEVFDSGIADDLVSVGIRHFLESEVPRLDRQNAVVDL